MDSLLMFNAAQDSKVGAGQGGEGTGAQEGAG